MLFCLSVPIFRSLTLRVFPYFILRIFLTIICWKITSIYFIGWILINIIKQSKRSLKGRLFYQDVHKRQYNFRNFKRLLSIFSVNKVIKHLNFSCLIHRPLNNFINQAIPSGKNLVVINFLVKINIFLLYSFMPPFILSL